MVKFEFYLSDNDYDRLYALKEVDKKDGLTGNEYAAELLSKLLRSRHPEVVNVEDMETEEL